MTLALRQSASFHLGFLALAVLLSWGLGKRPRAIQNVKISIQEVQRAESERAPEPVVQVTATPPPANDKVKPVFGLTKTAHTSQAPGAVEIKAGNTLAKPIDQDIAENTDALPVPAAEYLVSQMPRLKTEVRIPYPREAHTQNVEGAVLMDLLIDEMGRVREARLIEGPGYGLNEAALEAVYRFEFEPARIEQKSVAVRIRYAYRFVLN